VDVSFSIYSFCVIVVLVLVEVHIVRLVLLNVDFIIFVRDVWLVVEKVVLRNGCVL
jgi:hypothetical protein